MKVFENHRHPPHKQSTVIVDHVPGPRSSSSVTSDCYAIRYVNDHSQRRSFSTIAPRMSTWPALLDQGQLSIVNNWSPSSIAT